jgi:hypothetical protein
VQSRRPALLYQRERPADVHRMLATTSEDYDFLIKNVTLHKKPMEIAEYIEVCGFRLLLVVASLEGFLFAVVAF